MKMGENTPEPLRRAVRRLAAESPRPLNKEILQCVKDLGFEISDKTVYNICRKAGLPTSSRSTSGINPAKDIQMEASGHWPKLRQTARELSTQLFLPLTQILQFPWSYSLNANLLLIPGKVGVAAGLSFEEEVLFKSLKEHLTRHRAWVLLRDWKSSVENIARGLNDLCSWLEEQPEVSGQEWLDEVGIDRGEVGLTRYFSKSLALVLAEEMFLLPKGSSDWEVLESYSQRETYVLNWVRNGSSFVHVAASREKGELERVKAVHQELSVRMKSLELTYDIGKEWLKLEKIIV